jgi:glycosyltransferase involved in cell wall biosynthesis
MYNVSVVIPAYNRHSTLPYCLTSVLNQTYPVSEIIVVDDGSSKPLDQLIERFSDPRIRLICHPNHLGAQQARNTGITEAKEDWIAFLDSDDEWLPNKLQKQVDALKKSNGLICCTDGYQKGHQGLSHLHLLKNKIPENTFSQILKHSFLMFQGLLVNKICFDAINGLDNDVPAFQEWDTMIRLSFLFEITLLQEPLFIYHLDKGPSISKDTALRRHGYAYVVKKHRDKITKYGGKELLSAHYQKIQEKCYGLTSSPP